MTKQIKLNGPFRRAKIACLKLENLEYPSLKDGKAACLECRVCIAWIEPFNSKVVQVLLV